MNKIFEYLFIFFQIWSVSRPGKMSGRVFQDLPIRVKRRLKHSSISEIKFKTKLGRILAVAITKIQDIMIKRMNHVSDKIIEYQREVINSLLTFDILQAHLTPAHIQNCCFEDFEYVYRQALSIKEVR